MPPIVKVVITDVTHKVNVATVVSNELIKTVVLRMVVLRVLWIALMPLSDDPGGIPC